MSNFRRLIAVSVLAAFAGTSSLSALHAQTLRPGSPEWLERCKRWIERKGYPVDYIEQRTGKRQPGFASAWKGNVKVEDVASGDVAILSSTMEDGRTVLVAAYVEAVEPPSAGSQAFLTISAMGLNGRAWQDQECFVGDTFGKVTRSREPASRVVRVWRPSLPLE